MSGDASARDLAAPSLREFLTCRCASSGAADSTASFYSRNVKSIVKRVCLLALHPASSKRLGAALAFNAVYAQFREEDSLVNAFAFELLHCFMRSIQLADADDASLGTVESQGRRTPARLKVDQRDPWRCGWAVRWLVGQCGQPESACRAAAMRLLVNDGSRTDRRSRFQPHQNQQQHPLGPLRALLACLECHLWSLGGGLLDPQQLLAVAAGAGSAKAVGFFQRNGPEPGSQLLRTRTGRSVRDSPAPAAQSGLASDPPSVAGAVRLARGVRALRDCGLWPTRRLMRKRQILDRCC
uniref:DNAPKcs_CC1-2 domain-containing protein n=1 Tax=Macrostomum lignano TaxID=282301 RepID=A0A1I8FCS2_9PLAT